MVILGKIAKKGPLQTGSIFYQLNQGFRLVHESTYLGKSFYVFFDHKDFALPQKIKVFFSSRYDNSCTDREH